MFNKTINYDTFNKFRFSDGPREDLNYELHYAANRLIEQVNNFQGSSREINVIRNSLVLIQQDCAMFNMFGIKLEPFIASTSANEIKAFTADEILDFVDEFKKNYIC